MGNCSVRLSKESESRLHLSSSRKKEKMDSKPVQEFHKTLIITHTLEVGDLTMVEVIEETTVTPQDPNCKFYCRVHFRLLTFLTYF
jgi:hypothetical protein